MSTAAVDLAAQFIDYVDALEDTRHKMEVLLSSGSIEDDDMEHVYAGLYLSLFATFEGLLDKLFFGLISGDITSTKVPFSTVTTISGTMARDILLIGRNYLDWLPYENTLEKAKVFLPDGKPFTLLDDRNKGNLQRFICIRNAIAHKSDYALAKFEKSVIGDSLVTPEEKTPVGYLRGIYRTAPSQTRYELVIQELKTISLILCR